MDSNDTSPTLPDLEGLKRKFRQSIDTSEFARDAAALDRGYYDGNRALSDAWRKHLDSHKLPPLNINIVKPIVNGHIGVVLQNSTDPEAWGRNPSDQDAADIVTKLLRYVADKTKFDNVKNDVVENLFIEGVGAVIVEADDRDVMIRRIHPNEFFWDVHSREYDFSDALYMGIAKWLHISQIYDIFPDAESKYGEISPGDMLGVNQTMKDAPDVWVDRKNKRVLVVEMYYVEHGRWKRIVFCHAGILDFGDSAYLDDAGRSICPIVAMSCYINQDHDDETLTYSRYGVVRSMIDPQTEYNSHRASMVKAAVSRRVQQIDMSAPVVDSKTVREEASRPDGVIPTGWQVVGGNDLTEQNALLQLARAEIDRMGPTPAVLGRSLGTSESGRSRMVQQQAGITELAPVLDRLERWENAVYEHMWHAVRQYWTAQMFVRVSGQERAAEFLEINVPVTAQQMAPAMGSDGQPMLDPMGQPIMRLQTVTVGMQNELATMDMDITITAVKENATLEHEVMEQIVQIAQLVPIGSPQFLMALQLFPLTNKRETLERIEAMMKQAQQQPDPAQVEQAQQAQQVALLSATAKAGRDAALAKKAQAEALRTCIEAQHMAGYGSTNL
ncbi:portal protein [Flavisphingomonas formosensis]|uniref:portal protein n=1 Tax=Flavisphingomonas formosensis TaxID=861534 RepID=UPI0012FAA7B5|nr:hypothetical protein [Sphingomonas formosensis]